MNAAGANLGAKLIQVHRPIHISGRHQLKIKRRGPGPFDPLFSIFTSTCSKAPFPILIRMCRLKLWPSPVCSVVQSSLHTAVLDALYLHNLASTKNGTLRPLYHHTLYSDTSSTPNQEIINDIVTKVEIDEFDEYDGLPEIIRNQAKSKRARAEARLSVASGKCNV